MLSINNLSNSQLNFGNKEQSINNNFAPQKNTTTSTIIDKIKVPTMVALMYMNVLPTAHSETTPKIESNINSEIIIDKIPSAEIESETMPTQLGFEDLVNAPNPKITINGEKINAGIVVDVNSNKLYRYNENGDVIDGFHVATGKIGKNGKSLTHTGIRKVDHIETYPYKSAVGTKRQKNPIAYGPKILYLTIVDSKTGEVTGSNGEFIHGNSNPNSIGTHASHGCVRMDNEVIKKLAKETPTGTYVLITNQE
jgi:lipoprotein-anchoring transpeptidase ErfK/SrfK